MSKQKESDSPKLLELLNEIGQYKQRLSAPIPDNNGTTIQGQLARKRTAKLRLPELEREYKNELRTNIVPIVFTGSLADEAAKALEAKGAIVVDGEGLYKELTQRMPAQASMGRMSPKVIVDILSRHFMDIASENDVVSYPAIMHKQSASFAVNSPADLERFVKRTVNASVGPEMGFIYNLKQISNLALESEITSKKIPVIFKVLDESLVEPLMEAYVRSTGSVFLLTVGGVSDTLSTKASTALDTADEKAVLTAVKKLKDIVNKNKTKGE